MTARSFVVAIRLASRSLSILLIPVARVLHTKLPIFDSHMVYIPFFGLEVLCWNSLVLMNPLIRTC